MKTEPKPGDVYSPTSPMHENKNSQWKVIAIDIYGRIFLETEQKSVVFYDNETFEKNFSKLGHEKTT